MCGFSAGTQENWLITQHISGRLSSGQLIGAFTVIIEYEFQLCDPERQCVQSFEIRKWETSAIDSKVTKKIENFVLVGSLSPNVSNNGIGTQTERINVEFDTQESGLYLALVDHGTCVLVHRVLVFYNGALCSGEQTGLIQHPEVIPPQNRVVGKCVANSSTLDGLDPALQCTDEGHWRVLTSCLCGPGFELTVVNGDASCTGKFNGKEALAYCRQRFGKSMVHWNLVKVNSNRLNKKGFIKKGSSNFMPMYTLLHSYTRLERRVLLAISYS